jgi:hypothetical protein
LIIHRRQGMPGRERHELPALTDEEYSAADEQPAGARSLETRCTLDSGRLANGKEGSGFDQ